MTPEARQYLQSVSNGNANAFAFMESWHDLAHLVDDLHDKDQPVTDEGMAGILVRFIIELAGNPFFQQHKAMLVPLMVQSFNAWVDSNRTPRPTERDVLKGYWHEVIYHCVFLTGGWDRLRSVCVAHREYDYHPDSLEILNPKEGE